MGDLLSGFVTKITNFGVFVKLENDLEGLLHISELSDRKIASPEEVVRPGMKIEVRVIRVDTVDRKIGLSFVHADFEENEAFFKQMEEEKASGTTPTIEGVEIESPPTYEGALPVASDIPEPPVAESPEGEAPADAGEGEAKEGE